MSKIEHVAARYKHSRESVVVETISPFDDMFVSGREGRHIYKQESIEQYADPNLWRAAGASIKKDGFGYADYAEIYSTRR